MGLAILGDVLTNWRQYELDDAIYLTQRAEPAVDLQVNVLPFDRKRKRLFEGQEYLLGIEQVRDVVEGLEAQLHRPPTVHERLKAVVYYAKHDAFIDPNTL